MCGEEGRFAEKWLMVNGLRINGVFSTYGIAATESIFDYNMFCLSYLYRTAMAQPPIASPSFSGHPLRSHCEPERPWAQFKVSGSKFGKRGSRVLSPHQGGRSAEWKISNIQHGTPNIQAQKKRAGRRDTAPYPKMRAELFLRPRPESMSREGREGTAREALPAGQHSPHQEKTREFHL
jgi:hypothetical protein